MRGGDGGGIVALVFSPLLPCLSSESLLNQCLIPHFPHLLTSLLLSKSSSL